MNVRDDAAFGRLAERLVWTAWDLAVMVREQDRDAIGEFLGGLTEAERAALPVVLAALVDPDRPLDDALAWITWDERGRPLRKRRLVTPRWRFPAGCGTDAGFRQHVAAGEDVDDLCEAAHAARAMRSRGAA